MKLICEDATTGSLRAGFHRRDELPKCHLFFFFFLLHPFQLQLQPKGLGPERHEVALEVLD
jgi:hypothetical protein